MDSYDSPQPVVWPQWKKILFRFFFIYLLLHVAPWTWLDEIPGVVYVTKYYHDLTDWAVNFSNHHFFHIRDVLVPMNGSGDTSYGWAQVYLYLSLAVIGCLIWSLFDRRRSAYSSADYWLCTFVRYFIIMNAMSYGLEKLFALQMPFPNESQMATPLGDFLPMRLSWMFIGYSTPYQVFSGVMEIITAILLFNRKTTTLGLIVGLCVFVNVMVLNLCYDIPVKIFSMHLVLYFLFLLAHDGKRLFNLFILNKPVPAITSYNIIFQKRWMRITKIIAKIAFIIIAVVLPFYDVWSFFKEETAVDIEPIAAGMYDVKVFVLNKDTLAPLLTDTIRWKDIIFQKGGIGSVNNRGVFKQRYGRGYFNYKMDSLKHTIDFLGFNEDEDVLFTLNYKIEKDNTIKLNGKFKSDSIYIDLVKSKHHFQLSEKQFHWLSEHNR